MVEDKKNLIYNMKIIYNEIKSDLKNHYKPFITIISGFLLVFLIRSILSLMDTVFIINEYPIQRILFITSTTLMILGLEIGFTKLIFEYIDNKTIAIGNIFNYFHLLGHYTIGLLIYYFFISICLIPALLYLYSQYNGEIFSIIYNAIGDPYFQELISSYFNINDFLILFFLSLCPSLYITMRLIFWSYFIIDEQKKGLNAFKKSYMITKSKSLEIICYLLIISVFNFVGVLSIIGLCFTIPLTYIFLCKYYRLLTQN